MGAHEDCWEVTSVGDGPVKTWNEQNPESVVEVGDKVVACNDVRGNGEKIRGAMKDGMKDGKELVISIAKAKSAPPENNAPPENHEVASAPVDDVPEPISAPLDTLPETLVHDTPESGVQETVEEDTTNAHVEANLVVSPVLKEPHQAPKNETIATMEEQPLRDNDCPEPARKPDGWMCCSGSRT